MKKILILTLALWTGTANFAYMAARIECASMMNLSAKAHGDHSCCPKPVPCQCSVSVPSNHSTVPGDTLVLEPSENFETLPTSLQIVHDAYFQRSAGVFESPPLTPPLFILFSVYRL